MKTVGVVLSGGGARGAAHLGVLAALNDLNINISAISGVSAGSIIGALYAAGHSPASILDVFKKKSLFGITDIAFMKGGLFSMTGLRNTLKSLIPVDDFSALKIPFYVTATDVAMGCSVSYSEGPLIDTVIASSSVPVVFEPVAYGGRQLLDGGILNNLPVEPLMGKYDVIIGSHVNKLHDGVNPVKLTKSSLIEQCFHMAIAAGVMQRSMACDVFIEPLLSGFGMFDMKAADALYEKGYAATMNHKDMLLALI